MPVNSGVCLSGLDTFIRDSENALHSPVPYPTAEALFFLKLEEDEQLFLPKHFRHLSKLDRDYYLRPGVRYQHDDIRPNLPLPLSPDFGTPWNSMPFAQAHSILRVFIENDEICFEMENTEKQLRARVWINKKKLLDERKFEATKVMDSDGNVRVLEEKDWERAPVKQASDEHIMAEAIALRKKMKEREGTK